MVDNVAAVAPANDSGKGGERIQLLMMALKEKVQMEVEGRAQKNSGED